MIGPALVKDGRPRRQDRQVDEELLAVGIDDRGTHPFRQPQRQG